MSFNRKGFNKNKNENKTKYKVVEVKHDNKNTELDLDDKDINRKSSESNFTNSNQINDQILETLVFFPGEQYPFNKELLTQGNFYLSKTIENNNDNINVNSDKLDHMNKKKLSLISKNFFSLSVCKLSQKKFNMSQQIQGNFYSPKVDDLVVGTIISKNMDFYKVELGTYSPAILGVSEFEGATKKTRPNLKVGDSIFAKILKTNKFDSPILTCISNDGKSWSSGEAFFGSINQGHMFKIPLNLVNFYFFFGEKLFSRLHDCVNYEFNLGHNGMMVINCDNNNLILKIKDVVLRWGKMLLIKFTKGDSMQGEQWFEELEPLLLKYFKDEIKNSN